MCAPRKHQPATAEETERRLGPDDSSITDDDLIEQAVEDAIDGGVMPEPFPV